jgi:hypothetical protein
VVASKPHCYTRLIRPETFESRLLGVRLRSLDVRQGGRQHAGLEIRRLHIDAMCKSGHAQDIRGLTYCGSSHSLRLESGDSLL